MRRLPGSRSVACGVAAGAVSAACSVGLLATSGWLITSASLRPPVLSLSIAIGAVQAFALARGAARYGGRLAVHDVALRRLGQLRLRLFEVLEPLVPGGLGRATTGSLLDAYVADTEAVTLAGARRLLVSVDVGATCTLGATLVLCIDWRCGLVVAAGAALAAASSCATSLLDGPAAEREAWVRAEVADAAVEAVRSAVELTAYGRADLVTARLDELGRRSAAAGGRRALVVGLGRATVLVVSGATLLAVLATGLADHGLHRLSGVALAVVVFATLAVLESCGLLPDALAVSRSGSVAAARLAALDRLEPPVAEPASPSAAPQRPAGAELEAARVVAPDGAVLLDRLSCAVAPGSRVALVGPSGSGKTTALHALLRFCRLESGHALLGGVGVAGLDRATLAARVGWVPEEPHVFGASVEANLLIAAPAASRGELVAALERAGLGEWHSRLPHGLATRVGAGGRPLSSGERQRLVLARALLAQPDVLLVDEPTAHLDPETAHAVLSGISEAAAGAALLVVTHDPAVRAFADDVVTLQAAEEPERAAPAERGERWEQDERWDGATRRCSSFSS
jgi:thiol reductant ABC exporter CydC subunit